MADIFKEVDEDLRAERYAKLWKRYGKFAIAAAVLLVAAVGGHQAWQAYDESQRLEASDAYAATLEAVANGDQAVAERALAELADPAGGGYGILAAFTEAGLQAEAGEIDAAVATLDTISGASAVPAALADAARLRAAQLLLDEERTAEAVERVEPLVRSGSAFRPLALEIQALAAIAEGDPSLAAERYREIGEDPTAPPGIRSRATQMLAALES